MQGKSNWHTYSGCPQSIDSVVKNNIGGADKKIENEKSITTTQIYTQHL